MAMARKCDRCGVCFDPLSVNGYMSRFKNPVFATKQNIREGTVGFYMMNSDGEGPDTCIDLCPKCSEDFETFMSVPSHDHSDIPNIPEYKEVLERSLNIIFGGDTDGD